MKKSTFILGLLLILMLMTACSGGSIGNIFQSEPKQEEATPYSIDCDNYDSLVSACNIALAKKDVMLAVSKGEIILQAGDGTDFPREWNIIADDETAELLSKEIANLVGENWETEFKVRSEETIGLDTATMKKKKHVAYTITLKTNGLVERTCSP